MLRFGSAHEVTFPLRGRTIMGNLQCGADIVQIGKRTTGAGRDAGSGLRSVNR